MLEAAETLPQRGELELWVKDLKSAFYEAEDILDAIDYQQLETRILSKIDDKSTASTNHKSALSCFGCKRKVSSYLLFQDTIFVLLVHTILVLVIKEKKSSFQVNFNTFCFLTWNKK